MNQTARSIHKDPRTLVERPVPQDGSEKRKTRIGRKVLQRSVSVNIAESPLGWLHSRGHLSDRQFDGGERLRADWERANLAPRMTMQWEEAPVSGGRRSAPDALDPTEVQIAAKLRFNDALETLGRDLSDICWRVICAGESVPVAEKDLGWPSRSGKLVLRLALDRLANFYRLPG